MKKFLLTLAVLAMAVPAMAADIDFTATDNGDGSFTISYVATTAPRGVALTIDTDGATIGDASLGENGDVLSMDAAYNCYMDYANFMELDTPGSYTVGAGHPLASQTQAGLPTFPASSFSVCMGVLDETENQLPGPMTSTDLITLQLSGAAVVDIAADTYRSESGAVGSTLTTNLPIQVTVTDGVEPSCYDALTAAEQATWDIYVGAPNNRSDAEMEVWCNQYQCRADGDNAVYYPEYASLNWLVYQGDLDVLLLNWQLHPDTVDPIADYDHAIYYPEYASLNWAVYQGDLDVLLLYWQEHPEDVDDCPGYVAP